MQTPRIVALTVIIVGVASAALIDVPPALAKTSDNMLAPLQIEHRTEMKIVAQVNASTTMPNGVAKQVMAVKNLYDQYTALGMKIGKDYDLAVVFRADGSQFLLTDAAYDLKVPGAHPPGNPNRRILEDLHLSGVKIFECGMAMKMKGYTPDDILPFSRIVVTGIGQILDLEKSGYMEVTP